MSEVPVQIIVAAYNNEEAAKNALDSLKKAQKEKLIKINNAAVLHKDEAGKLHIKETADMGGGRGAALGGVAGAAIGLIAGPALLVPAAVGALVGGLTAKLRDSGFKDPRLEKLGEGLKPGSSAIIAVVEHSWVAKAQEAMAKTGADTLTAAISEDISQQLDAGNDVAYTAIATREGFTAGRVAAGKDMVEGGQVVVDDSGVYGSRFVATKDGFAVVAMDASGQAIAVTGQTEDTPKLSEGKTEEEKMGDKGEEEGKPPKAQ
jgi:uncharacterized membrane protein